ncbi:MAG: hypothetical protein APR54_11250 [Candidatus Cloacimonas sp. SDB]|nr:MAG: hypothetical protein APR54_11250 [Candidatus Cloacimonas sp. SDB]
MEGNKYTTNILIILIGLASIILGVMLANLAFQISGRKNASPEVDEYSANEVNNSKTIADEMESRTNTDKYETCVLISTDENLIINSKETLEERGYPVKIKESQRANKLIFSLFIDKQLLKEDAILLGEEIKANFPDITSYWVEKISDSEFLSDHSAEDLSEESVTTEELPEIFEEKTDTTEPSLDETSQITKNDIDSVYEVQLLANTDLDKVEAVKMLLESEGYRLKIIDFEKDGVIYYRLRLAEAFTLDKAKITGEELKEKFNFIQNYWIDKKVK